MEGVSLARGAPRPKYPSLLVLALVWSVILVPWASSWFCGLLIGWPCTYFIIYTCSPLKKKNKITGL